jgi:hypothetical protein
MSNEGAVNSTGGDNVALAKSFIIDCKGPVLNWYSFLPPYSICSWIDLKTKFIQSFQVFHETNAKPSLLLQAKRQRTTTELHKKIRATKVSNSGNR